MYYGSALEIHVLVFITMTSSLDSGESVHIHCLASASDALTYKYGSRLRFRQNLRSLARRDRSAWLFNPSYTSGSKMRTLANSEYPYKMPHHAVFPHQVLYFFAREKRSSEKETHFYWEIITCGPSIYTIDHP